MMLFLQGKMTEIKKKDRAGNEESLTGKYTVYF